MKKGKNLLKLLSRKDKNKIKGGSYIKDKLNEVVDCPPPEPEKVHGYDKDK